jgi:hypothetical protein
MIQNTRPEISTAMLPPAARQAAAEALHALAGTLCSDLPDGVPWDEHAARIVAVALHAIDPSMLAPGHTLTIVDGDGDDSWSLQHPLSCRPNIHACELNLVLVRHEELTWPFLPGTRAVRLGSCGYHVLTEDAPDHPAPTGGGLLCRTPDSGTVS